MIIKTITLGDIPKIAAIFKDIPAIVGDINNLNTQTILEKLPEIIEKALPEVAKLTAICTDIKEEDVISLPLSQFTEIVVRVMEENNFEEVFKNVKKVAALRARS